MTEAGAKFIHSLTPREKEVVCAVCSHADGDYREIGASLGMSAQILKNWLKSMLPQGWRWLQSGAALFRLAEWSRELPMREISWLTRPINDVCVDCGKLINPKADRQELAADEQGRTRRRCGECIAKRAK